MKLDYTILSFDDVIFKKRDAEKLRGYFAANYPNFILFHNHDDGGFIYNYPRVQYKVIDSVPIICGIEEGAGLISKVSLLTDELDIEGKNIKVIEKGLKIGKSDFGVEDDYIQYEFLTPWIALNQNNLVKYKNETEMGKEELLQKILIGNLISMSKGLNYTVEKQIKAWINLKPVHVKLKNIDMIAFIGRFKVNFKIPDYLGIGKSVSKGFGTVKKI